MFGSREHLFVVFAGEVSFEAMDTAQVQFAASDNGKQDREAACRARGSDALAGRRLRHMVPGHEKSEQGGVAQLGPQLAPIDGVDVAEQVGVALMVLP